jgi:hypothetical protein
MILVKLISQHSPKAALGQIKTLTWYRTRVLDNRVQNSWPTPRTYLLGSPEAEQGNRNEYHHVPVPFHTQLLYQYCRMQCCGTGAGAGGAATFCWSRSQSFFGPAPAPGM